MNKDKYGVLYQNNPDGSLTISIDRLKRYYNEIRKKIMM